jgi:xanthine/uracil/vitamin C permease (AzgA family)
MDLITIGRVVVLTICTIVGVRAWLLRTAPRRWRLTAIAGCAVLIPALGLPGKADALSVVGYIIAAFGLVAFLTILSQRPVEP